jgi:hypothetical protein
MEAVSCWEFEETGQLRTESCAAARPVEHLAITHSSMIIEYDGLKMVRCIYRKGQ